MRLTPFYCALIWTAACLPGQGTYSANVVPVQLLPEAVNDAGTVVGTGGALSLAAVVGPNQPYLTLPLPAGYAGSSAESINDFGWVVGAVHNNSFNTLQAALWKPDGLGGYSVELLALGPVHTRTIAKAINNAGEIVGTSYQVSGADLAVRFDGNGVVVDLTPFGAPLYPIEINDQGVVLGQNSLFDLHALQPVALPPLPSTWLLFAATTINDVGGIGGRATTAAGPLAVVWYPGLGWNVLGNQSFFGPPEAFDLSNRGVATGVSSWPIVWSPSSGSVPLSSLMPLPSWFFLGTTPVFVTDSGMIIGQVMLSPGQLPGIAFLTPDGCQQAIGHQGPGSLAATMCGDGLAPGNMSEYVATGAPPMSGGVALVSLGGQPNFVGLGGTLWSFGGFFAAVPLQSDAFGMATLPVPGQPSPGVDLIMQSAFVDPSLPQGLTFSNAIVVRLGQ